jgi:hypothetical protein
VRTNDRNRNKRGMRMRKRCLTASDQSCSDAAKKEPACSVRCPSAANDRQTLLAGASYVARHAQHVVRLQPQLAKVQIRLPLAPTSTTLQYHCAHEHAVSRSRVNARDKHKATTVVRRLRRDVVVSLVHLRGQTWSQRKKHLVLNGWKEKDIR